ncbi:MAG: hypothetical protein HXS41_09575 [Theionarchaea archaeon]|nr:hypothetical protein [Theionarchaea archaeon]MBU7001897.1 hypothetical protein [Theionarchaea archaeon]MBU7021295.1 hypothetical protein [Theionarchaea archaeon]MBU7036170.1 hypothetical protein [Theionarchaea archaeon]MBU7040841.1 hypothetical protein [Theionarchaea archaeon]
MKSGFIVVLILLSSVIVPYAARAEEYAELTVVVTDIYGDLINDARVSINYVFPQDDDVDIPYQFTKNGKATFSLEADREYSVSVTKAGFSAHSEQVDLEEDTTLSVILEYMQSIPLLRMKRYSVTPEQVGAGESFQLYVVIENGGTGDALNVTVTFSQTEDFSPGQPSSSAYFERLDTKELASVLQTFVVSGETPSGVYDLTVTISYSDASGSSYTTQESVGISVLRKPLIKLLNVGYSMQVTQDESFKFSADIANIGRFTVNGVYLEVESDMDWEYTSYYIGSLDAGDFDSFEADVVATEPGEHTFIIRIGFVDDFNKGHFQEESFSLVVTEKVVQQTFVPEEKGLWQRFIDFLKSFLGLN